MNTIPAFDRLRASKAYPSVTILLPTHRTAPENHEDALVLKNLVAEARERLLVEFDARTVKPILDALDGMQAEIDHQHNLEGLALFANAELHTYLRVPVAVQALVAIDASFHIRPLVRSLNAFTSYYVLTLSEGQARLFDAAHDRAKELHAQHFPLENKHLDSAKLRAHQHEREDQEIRAFYEEVDQRLGLVLQAAPRKVLLAGEAHLIDLYRQVSRHGKALFADIAGNYGHSPAKVIGTAAWLAAEAAIARLQAEELDHLGEAIGQQKAALGVVECYELAAQGRGTVLLVEEDYFQPARIQDHTLDTDVQATDPGVEDDIVDEIIGLTLAYGGRVAFLPPGALQHLGTEISLIFN